MSSKRSFSQLSGFSGVSRYESALKSSRGLRRGKITRTAYARPSSGVRKKKGPVTRREVSAIAKAVVERNLELKYYDDSVTGQTVGQVNNLATGHNSITFGYPTNGPYVNGRIGDKIKLKSITLNANFWGMASQSAATKLVCYLVWFKGVDVVVDINDFLNKNQALYDLNAVNIYDPSCFRNVETGGSVKVLASWELYLKESSSVSGTAANQTTHGSYQKEIPLNLVQTFEGGNPGAGELVLYTLSSIGNRSATASTLTGIPLTTANTGYQFNLSSRLQYTDA